MAAHAPTPGHRDTLLGAAGFTLFAGLSLIFTVYLHTTLEAHRAVDPHLESLETLVGTLAWLHGLGYPAGLAVLVWLARRAAAREAEVERQAAEARLGAEVFTAAAEGIVVTDPSARILRVNPAFCGIFGYTPGEVVGQNCRILASGRHDRAFYEAFWEALLRDGRWQGEIWNRRKGGEHFPERLSVTALRDPAGGVTGYVGILSDTSEEVRNREALAAAKAGLETRVRLRTAELQAANRDLEAFAYTVAHDLRAPLRTVEGLTASVLDEEQARLTPGARASLDRARAAAERMQALIEDLLQLARVGTAALSRKPVDLRALVEGICGELLPQYPGTRLDVGDLGVADGDPAMLRQLFQNLLANALKFSAKRAEPQVRIWRRSDTAGAPLFGVEDNGAGFDPTRASELFQPFHRLHAQRDFPGTGVGLAIVRRVVERHGGRIAAIGAPERGARFEFTLGAGE